MCSPSVANALSSVKRRDCVSNVGIITNTKTVIYKNFVRVKRKKKKRDGGWEKIAQVQLISTKRVAQLDRKCRRKVARKGDSEEWRKTPTRSDGPVGSGPSIVMLPSPSLAKPSLKLT